MKAQVNVIERTELTSLWLRRQFGDEILVRHCPLEAVLPARDTWIVWRVIDGKQLESLEAALVDVFDLRRRFPHALIVAQVLAVDPDYLFALNRAGASIVVHRAVHAVAAADQIRNFYRQIPRPCLSLEDRIWENLPWGQ